MKAGLAGALALAATGTTSEAQALGSGPPPCNCTYTVGNPYASGDHFYRNLSWFAGSTWCGGGGGALALAIGMDPTNWSGAGFLDCSMSKPFGRTMNGLTALLTASSNPVSSMLEAPVRPMLDWAGKWVVTQLDHTHAYCEDADPAPSAAQSLPPNGVNLFLRLGGGNCGLGFFHGFTAVERAATFVHEVRHYQRPKHAAPAQDFYWGWGGAYEWEARWLEQYITMGNPATTSKVTRCLARARLKNVLTKHFVVPASFILPGVEGC
ncbi:MAG: hypothetical protein KC731_20460 [Myxococcales bacterium]|nr:hypothetical protein [Myxococcales bacterium]